MIIDLGTIGGKGNAREIYIKCKTKEQVQEVQQIVKDYGSWHEYTSLAIYCVDCALNKDDLEALLFKTHSFSPKDIILFDPSKRIYGFQKYL